MRLFLRLFGAMGSLAFLAANTSASAAPQTYVYSVENDEYGVIGTYTDTIDNVDGNRRIDTKLRVAIKVFGIVLYREEADRTELWQGGRLTSFHGLTTVNGESTEVRGESRGDGFSITSPSGTFVAPPGVYTSSPWSVELPKPDIMMSTKNGRVERVQVIDEGVAMTKMNGSEISLRHYKILSSKRQDAWIDIGGVPVRFRSEERGSPVDFVLKHECFAALVASRR